MKTQEQAEEVEPPRSRFSYFGDEESEGGVQSVQPAREGPGSRTQSKPAGTPGPAEKLLDISEIARTLGMRYTHHFSFPAGREGDMETVTPTVGSVTLTNAGAALLLTGKVATHLRMECGRCLTPTDQPVEVELDEHFDLIASNNAFNQEVVQAQDEDSPAAVITSNVLNLADLLRQNLVLAAPLQPLCSEDCPGIPYDPGAPPTEPDTAIVGGDNPLRRLADLLEAKRRSESESS